MVQEFEVTVRLRLTVQDSEALVAAAGGEVPDALRDDQHVAMQVALQALVRRFDVELLPGVKWSSGGWHAQVRAEPLQE